jgi:hypothetical protein
LKNKIFIYIFILYISAFFRGVLDFIPNSDIVSTNILLLIDLSIVIIGLSCINRKHNIFSIVILIIFIILSSFSFLVNNIGIINHLNGVRELLVMFCVFPFLNTVMHSFKWRRVLKKRFDKFSIIFLVAQIPFTVYQFFRYGAGDSVGGTLGFGYSGILTFIVLLLVFFRIKAKLKTQTIFKAYANLLFLLPIFLNETKISFILIPFMFLFIINIKNKSSTIIALIAGMGMFFLLNNYYSDGDKSYKNSSSEIFSEDFLQHYLVGDNIEDYNDIPRFTKILIGFNLITENTYKSLFGIEYGAFKGGKSVSKSKFSKDKDWLLKGTVPTLFYLMISGGFLLTILVIFYFFRITFRSEFYDNRNKYFLFLLLLIILFYNEAIRIQVFTLIFFYFLAFSQKQTYRLHENTPGQ